MILHKAPDENAPSVADACLSLCVACMPVEVVERCHTGAPSIEVCRSEASTSQAQERIPRILVGHSLGCAAMVTSFIKDLTNVDGLVLVAPAIIASPLRHRAQLLRREVR
jgi:predicted alpha/beta hydrolase family esterase